jgi:putative ABC transport system permease protein
MPDWRPDIASRLGALRLDPAREAEIIDELSQHLDQRYDELLSEGATADEAFRTAVGELRDAQALATAMRPLRQARVAPREPRDPRLARLAADLRISIRTLFRQRAFSIAAVLTFAIGIGAASAIATIVDAVLLRSLPYLDAERIVQVVSYRVEGGPPVRAATMARPFILGLGQRSRSFAAFGVYDSFSNVTRRRLTMNVTGSAGTAALLGTRISPVLFGMFGATPQLGRLFVPGDDLPERHRIIILSDRAWRTQYGGDPGVVGSSLTMDGRPYTLVGIMSPGFAFPDRQTDFWIPYTSFPGLAPSEPRSDTPNSYSASGVFARLRDGVSVEAASAETDALLRTLSLENAAATGRKPEETGFPPSLARRGEVVSMKDEMIAPVRPMLRMLAAAGALLLLIACANLVTLFLERSDARRAELDVRRALGASRRQLLRQFVVEGAVLSAAGGVAGAALAYWMVQLVVLVVPSNVPRADEIAVTAPVLAAAIAAAVVLGVVLSVGSAWRQPRRSPTAMVVAEVALAVVLCVGAGLLVRSFIGLVNVNPGYDTRDVTTFQLVPPFGHSFDTTRVYEDVLSRLSADPAIQAVAATDILPVAGASAFHLNLLDLPAAPGSEPMILRLVTRQYFQAMGMRLAEGRTFAEAGGASYQELILSEQFVRRYFPGKSPLGQIVTAGPARYQVIGVVNDARQSGLNATLRAEYYVDLTRFGLTAATRPHFVVRSGAGTSHLGPLIRSTVKDIDPRLGVDLNQQTLAELTSASVATPRFNTFVLSAFAAVALALAIVGIYGVLSHAVTRRTREIGIRMAVGAVPSRVLAMILRQSLMVTGTGAVIGLLMAAGTTRYLESMLFELTPLDPWTFLAVAAMALVVAVLAAYPPAARASRVDPLAALRHD